MLPVVFTLLFITFFEISLFQYKYNLVMFSVFATLSAFIGCWYLSEKIRASLLASSCAVIAFFFLNLSENILLAQALLGLASFLLYLVLSDGARQRSRWVAIVASIQCYAFLFLILYYQIFFALPIGSAMTLAFLCSSMLFFISLTSTVSLSFALEARTLLFALIAGFLVAEFYFVFSKLPFNIISIGFLLLCIYYILWDTALRYFTLRFTKRSALSHALLLVVSFMVMFVSNAWFH